VRRRPLVLFFVLAYAGGWLVFVPLVLLQGSLVWTALATAAPTVAAVVTHRVTAGSWRAVRVIDGWPRALAAGMAGVVLMAFTYVVLPGNTATDPSRLQWSVFASVGVYNYSTLVGGPLGEEPGWRGYALPRLQAVLGPVQGTVVLAVLWAAWHLPLFFYPGWVSAPLWIYALILLGASFILSFIANLARFNVLAPIVTHAAFNTVSGWLAGFFSETRPNVGVQFELVLAACGLAVSFVLLGATRGRLLYDKGRPEGRPLPVPDP
jgi:membrane protease YdiL (CAAX protease family)